MFIKYKDGYYSGLVYKEFSIYISGVKEWVIIKRVIIIIPGSIKSVPYIVRGYTKAVQV